MYINPINNKQTNFEAKCPNTKRRGKAPHPGYRRKPKPKHVQQVPVSNPAEINPVPEKIIFFATPVSESYDWRLDTNHIWHGKEIEPPDEFFEALCNYYKSPEYHGLDYEPIDEMYDDDII